MNIILSLVLGGIAGWIASVIMKTNSEQGTLFDILLGLVGGFVGGLVMGFFGKDGITGFNLYSLIVAVIGAVILIAIGRFFKK